MRAHAAGLEAQGEPHLAALHHVSLDDVAAAVAVYRRAGLLREALALGAARLLPDDPTLQVMYNFKLV